MAARQQLRGRAAPLVATFVLIPRVEIVEGLARAGFDAVVLDLEHGPYGVGDLTPLIAAAHGAGAQVLARVGEASPAAIGAVLDTGVDGVVVPHVDGPGQARAAVAAVRYPPQGMRSLNPYVRAAAYGEACEPDRDPGAATETYLASANDGVALFVMVEGTDGYAALPEITAISGVDGIFVGPVDLSAALGFPGQPEHPRVVATVREILEKSRAAGCATAVYCPTPEAARRWLDAGARLVILSADMAMATSGFRSFVAGVGAAR